MRIEGWGVIEDGFTFTEAEIARAAPRFWWGPRKRAAYERVLDRRGYTRERQDEDASHESSRDSDRRDTAIAGTAAAAAVLITDSEKRQEGGGSWFGGGGGDSGGGSSDSGTSSSDSGGGGGSSE